MPLDLSQFVAPVTFTASTTTVTVVVEAVNVTVECLEQHIHVRGDNNVVEVVSGGPMGPPGPPGGPPGPPGPPGRDGQIRFSGHGPPPVVIVGAIPGDTYLDLDTGDIYQLV